MKKRTRRIIKKVFRGLGILFMLIVLVFLIQRTIGYKMQKATISQLRNNLNSERTTREELEQKLEKLEVELANKTIEADASEQKQTESTESNSNLYLQAKFPSDGNYYVDSFQSSFYKDVNCTQIIENPRFMSCKIDESLESPSGFPIKAMRLDSGELCYCPRDASVYLVTEQEWEEYQAEQ